MPNCFNLTRKGATEPEKLVKIDAEICKMLGVECHPKRWALWYQSIGWLLAEGYKLGSDKLRSKISSFGWDEQSQDELTKSLAYLEKHFTSNAWAEIGRR